jgi:hypothetical protein
MLPTIVGWMVQWKVNAVALATVNDRLVAPGARSPRSAAPPSTTTWWTIESLFFQTRSPPVETWTGFGEKALLPLEPTIETVTGVGAAGAGVGLVGVAGAGEEGVEDPPDDDPPPQAQIAGATAKAKPRSSTRCMLMVPHEKGFWVATAASKIPEISSLSTIFYNDQRLQVR